MITRADFEMIRNKRAYAERQYAIVSAMIFAECRENGIFSDIGGQLTEIHHIWSRAQCPKWFIFQKENLIAISRELHYAIHNKAYSDMTEGERVYYDYFQEVKEKLKQDNDNYNRGLTENFT